MPRLTHLPAPLPSGTSFPKDPKTSFSAYDLLFDTTPAPHVELRCQEVMAAVPPSDALVVDPVKQERKTGKRLSLMRKADGMVVVSRVEYLG